MDAVNETAPILPSLDSLKAAALEQIMILSRQKETLQDISTDLNNLIIRYNAQKSYLGYAAHWYGELSWWFKLIVSSVVAGIATLLAVPWVISVALSLVSSFLLINHHQVTQTRDRLVCEDLHAQNVSVQTSLDLLNATKEELERSLQTLCQMNIDMGTENLRLRNNIDIVTQQAEGYKEKTVKLQKTIVELEENEHLLTTQLSAVQEKLSSYERMLEDGTLAFARNNMTFQASTLTLQEISLQAQEVVGRFTHQVDTYTSPIRQDPQSSPDSHNGDSSVLSNAATAMAHTATADRLLKLNQQQQQLQTPVTKGNAFK